MQILHEARESNERNDKTIRRMYVVTILPLSSVEEQYFSREAKLDLALTSMEDSPNFFEATTRLKIMRRNLQLFRCSHTSPGNIIPLRTRCFETFPRDSSKNLNQWEKLYYSLWESYLLLRYNTIVQTSIVKLLWREWWKPVICSEVDFEYKVVL